MSTEMAYGIHAVRALLERHPDRVREVSIVREREDPRARQLETLARERAIAVRRVEAEVLRRRVGDAAHQGVIAEITPLAPWSEDDLLSALERTADPLILALDGVQDPHNLGACLRCADACGALAVVAPRDRAARLTPAARKVAAGAAESTPFVACTNLARTLRLLKQAGLWIHGADAEASVPAYEADMTGGTVLVLGAEGGGLRQLTRQGCDFLVRLPRLGAVESLNVSVAAGMLLYEAARQRALRQAAIRSQGAQPGPSA
ncbi:MAG: 23S rRNA (guanosine(2251)-2'-O)-methyltransferase RlmB [Steroidobacteraceae bacterium]